jgi:mannose-6-phosphate isomerase-like protein (cupin superfamily)
VIAGREIERDAFGENALRLAPFGFGGGIVEALNGITDGDDEGGIFGNGFLPYLLEDSGLRFAGAVAEDHEVEAGGEERVKGEEREKAAVSHFVTVRVCCVAMIAVLMGLVMGLVPAFAADDRVKIDNDAVRVLHAVDEPHRPSAVHRHELNRVMVYLTDGDLTARYQDRRTDAQHWKAGQVAWSPAGGLHTSENVGSKPLHIIEVELKKVAAQKPARDPKLDPVAIDPEHNILLFENAQVRVFRSWREAGGTEKLHEHTGTGRVGVFLTDLDATVKLADGSSSALHVKAGDSSWSGPVTHATTNLGPNKLEMIVIEVY